MPPVVTITRKRHPLEGNVLPLFGWMRRHGRLELVLELPDGSRSLIPAAWTDLEPRALGESDRAATLARLDELQRARLLVDSLLRRVDTGDRVANELNAKER